MTINLAVSVVLSDISSDILYEKPAAYAEIGLLEKMMECNGGILVKLGEQERRRLLHGGETSTLALKGATPRPVEMAERSCGVANARDDSYRC
jgi:hypothetical protein